MPDVTPTGASHEVPVDDLFFSTTDRKGIIEESNSVFERLSYYSRDELAGAPHNIIRHPAMPGGAFKLVWDTIEAGRPACAYVTNLAKNGSEYKVFATLMPVGEKYLSVRIRPTALELQGAAEGLYAEAVAVESQARAEGASARDAAVAGAQSLAQGLGGIGLESFDDFAWLTLPAEVSGLLTQGSGLPRRPDAAGAPAQLLAAMHDIHTETLPLVRALEQFADLATTLHETGQAVAPAVQQLTDATAKVRAASGTMEDLTDIADVMGERAENATRLLGELGPHVRDLWVGVRHMRFRIALLRLHNMMVGRFAAEVIDEGLQGAGPAVRLLCEALHAGADEMAADLATMQERLAAVPDESFDLMRELTGFRRQVYKWSGFASEGDVPDEAKAAADSLISEIDSSVAMLDKLTELAVECKNVIVPFSKERLDAHVAAMAQAAVEI